MEILFYVGVLVVVSIALYYIFKGKKEFLTEEMKTIARLRNKVNVNMKQHEIEQLRAEVVIEAAKTKNTYLKVNLLDMIIFLYELEEIAIQEQLEHREVRETAKQCYAKMCRICDSEDELSRYLSFWKILNKRLGIRTFTIDDIKKAYRAGKNGWYQERKVGNNYTVAMFKGTEQEYIESIKPKNKKDESK